MTEQDDPENVQCLQTVQSATKDLNICHAADKENITHFLFVMQ